MKYFVPTTHYVMRASLTAPLVKNLPAMQETQEILELVPGLGRCPRGGHGNPTWKAEIEIQM